MMNRRSFATMVAGLLGLPVALLGKRKADRRQTKQTVCHIVDESGGIEYDATYRVVDAADGRNINIELDAVMDIRSIGRRRVGLTDEETANIARRVLASA